MKIIIIVGVVCTLSIASLCYPAVQYTITDLGAYLAPRSINDLGQVAGDNDASVAGYIHEAFFYDGATVHNLGTLGGMDSSAISINNSGQITGISSTDYQVHGFLYENGSMQDIGTLGGNDSYATGINNLGQIVGYGATANGYSYSNVYSFLYDGTTMQTLSFLGEKTLSYCISDNGYIAGESHSVNQAFVYDGVSKQNIGTLGGSSSNALAINNNGFAVGWSDISGDAEHHAFCYDGISTQDIGTLGGGSSIAHSINDDGIVVGSSEVIPSAEYIYYSSAFVYDGKELFNLNDLISADSGWVLLSAEDINASGQIVGCGYMDFEPHGFLLTPVPGPATVSLVVLGCLSLRKRK